MKTQDGHIWAESNDGLKRLVEIYRALQNTERFDSSQGPRQQF
jgi:hypothetical protein